MFRFRIFALLLAIGAFGALLPVSTRAEEKPHPRIHQALYELREAKTELKEASPTFGGHRVKALEAVNAAIDQLEKALKFSGDPRPYKGDPKAEVYKKYKSYPHIRHAAYQLKETVTELKEASHNYGGHRVKALEAIDVAITELQACIRFADKGK
jgi:hypothetical protein